MFSEIQYRPDFRIAVFFVHLVLFPAGLFTLIVASDASLAVEAAVETLGFPLGILVATLLPRYASEGRWIPAVPVGIFLVGMLYEFSKFPVQRAALMFSDHTILALLTLPMWGCFCYGGGIAVAMTGQKK